MIEDLKPWTWKVPEGFTAVDRGLSRQDAIDKVSGQAVYTRDLNFPGLLYAKILTSPYAHAKIVRMDIGEAKALLGVRDILRFDDPDISLDNVTGGYCSAEYNILTLPGTSDFYQHPMGVAIVADSEEICDQALRLIDIEWEEQPFILDMKTALKSESPRIMPEVMRLNRSAKEPNAVMSRNSEIGNVEKGFSAADTVFEYEINRSMNTTAGVEGLACVAQFRGEFLDIWTHHPANMQPVLSNASIPQVSWNVAAFGRGGPQIGPNTPTSGRNAPLPPFTEYNKITLTYPYQGALYGGIAWLAYATSFVRLAVVLAKRARNRPIKLLYDESNFYCNGDDEGSFRCKVGVKKDGTITACHWQVTGVIGDVVTEKTHICTKIPNLKCTQEWALINKGHAVCFRHGAQSCVPHNVMFDKVAAELQMDPTEVAIKNDGCNGNDWDWVARYQKENGFPQRQSLREVIALGKKAIDWDRKYHVPGALKLANGRMHGIAFMSINQWNWLVGGYLSCLVLREGKLTIIGARADVGVDSESGFRQCVAAELGLKYEDTVIQQQRSDAGTFEFCLPGGAMGTCLTTPQLVLAARELKKKILGYAVRPRSGFMGMGQPLFPEKKIEELDIKDSYVFDKSNPSNRMSVKDVSSSFWSDDPAIVHPSFPGITSLTLEGKPHRQLYVMSRQAHFLEAEVDTETGEILVKHLVCVNDIGHIFNRRGAEAQQYGGAIMGLGRSATEEKIYCPRTGVGLNYDHIGYHLGTMNDYPPIHCILNESHLGYSAYGAYGMGEDTGAALSGITAGAIFNATGRWALDYPLTPDRVLKALGKI
jgi:CO/xanthine dehydrogenase Mo-binding subunit